MNTQTQTASAQDVAGFVVTTQAVETIKQGEFVRRLTVNGFAQSKTYQRGTYDRATKRYSLVDCDDTNREVWVRKGTKLAIGFTY